jgi:hypothetical protein
LRHTGPIFLAALLLLGACSQKPKVSTAKPPPQVQTASREEPVFYNGSNYFVRYDYNAARGVFDVKVTGKDKPLGARDSKAASEIATGAVRFFACPKGQVGKISGKPSFSGGVWSMAARCG